MRQGWRHEGMEWISPAGERMPAFGGSSDAPEIVADPPPAEMPPADPPPPTADEQVAALREENAHLRGQVETLAAPPPRSDPPAALTTPTTIVAAHAAGRLNYADAASAIDGLYTAGHATDRERVEAIADLRTEQKLRERDHVRARDQVDGEVKGRMRHLMEQHPELRVATSALMQDVVRELADLERLGYAPDELRTQVVAIERVTGRPAPPSVHDYSRRRIPAGGAPGGGAPPEPTRPADKSRGQQLFERMNEEAQAFYRDYHKEDRAAIYKTLNYADEGMLTRAGRFAR